MFSKDELHSQIVDSLNGLNSDELSHLIIYPYGMVGRCVKDILNNEYNIREVLLLDNNGGEETRPLHYLSGDGYIGHVVFLASINLNIYFELKKSLKAVNPEIKVIELPYMKQYAERCYMNDKAMDDSVLFRENGLAAYKGNNSYYTKKAESFYLCTKDKCTGCGACANSCPLNLIELKEDDEGFRYPQIGSKEQCTECGACKKACPIINSDSKDQITPLAVYAGFSNDPVTRYMSSSGGAFSEFARFVFKMSGVCYGAAYDDDFLVTHVRIDKEEELPRIRQSKYYQSNIDLIYREVKKDLTDGRYVLFSGAPCQCAGLHSFLGKEYSKLIIIDFICHGICSPKAFLSYKDDCEHQTGKTVERVWFRNKETTWNNSALRLDFCDKNGYYIRQFGEDPYFKGFLKHRVYIRPSCHECSFKGYNRFSDITLADFWGLRWNNSFGEPERRNGVSEIIINSEKGERIFDLYVKGRMFTEEHLISEVQEGNPSYYNSVQLGEYRDFFFEKMGHYPFSEIINAIDMADDLQE